MLKIHLCTRLKPSCLQSQQRICSQKTINSIYLSEVNEPKQNIRDVKIIYITREENKDADTLVNIAPSIHTNVLGRFFSKSWKNKVNKKVKIMNISASNNSTMPSSLSQRRGIASG